MAQGHHLHLRLFLEGVEVPVVSASVQVSANTPAAATIQVVATDKVLDLLPRTVVHLFYYDYVEQGNSALDLDDEILQGDKYVDWFNSKYKLLFMGELITIQFSKAAGQRAVILQCSDFSNYWDTTFQYNFNGSLFGGRRQAAFIGANSNFFTSPLGHGTGTISRLLNGRSANFPELRGLLAGVVRMLEAIGGSYYGRNTFRGCNDFTSIAELRVKVLQQITAAEKDTTTASLFARKAFNMWMNRQTGSLGTLVSFRGLTKMMFKFIFHEVYPCPVAKFVKASSRIEKRRYSVGIAQTEKYKGFAGNVQSALNLVNTARDNGTAWSRKRAKSSVSERSSLVTTYVSSWTAAERAVRSVYGLGSTVGGKDSSQIQKYLAVAQTKMAEIRSLTINKASRISANFAVSQGWFYGSLDTNWISIDARYKEVAEALEDILKIRIGKSSKKTVPTQSRVNNQIFRPDIWFTAPPRSNVLFPETYDQFQFSRQYLREVSRMELQTHNEILGNDSLFNGRYYAPNVADVRSGVRLSSRRFARVIMDHELYTGIIPMFENMAEANLYAMRSGKVTKAGARVSYAQRAVNHQYFKYRFESRSMTAGGRFNPQFIPGFPSLIIDKYMGTENLAISALPVGEQTKALNYTAETAPTRAELLRELVSPQYLGVCAALSHTVSQEGGRTQYQFMQARVHRESTEFLGVDKVTKYTPTDGGNFRRTIVAYPLEYPPKKGMIGPHGGKINGVKDVTGTYIGKAEIGKPGSKLKTSSSARSLPLLGTSQRVVVGSRIPPWLIKDVYNRTSHIAKSNDDGLIVGAFEVTEGSVAYRKDKIDLPVEEAVAPPWLWDGWRNPKVSETYSQLFGTTAITDIAGYDAKVQDRFYGSSDENAGLLAEKSAVTSGATKNPSGTRGAAKIAASQHQNAVLLLDGERTIENSVDFLVRSYSFIKINNLDVGDFLRAYGWRPVATIVDILGGSDLDITQVTKKSTKVVRQRFLRKKARVATFTDATGKTTEFTRSKAVYGTRFVKREVSTIGYEVTGTEGFHSRAFGDVEDLFGLVSPTVRTVLGLSADKRKVAARLDVRKRRRAVVRAYVAELTGSRGLIG